MNAVALRIWGLILVAAPLALADDARLDVRRGVPASAYIAVYAQHNPERDYLREYEKQIWQTISDEKLCQRALAIVMGRLPGEERDTVTSISDELQAIFEPVDWSAVGESPEVAYAQVMEMPQTHHLFLLRLPSEDVAINLETALNHLGEMVERRSEGAVDASRCENDGVAVYTVSVPQAKEMPFQPAWTRIDDVLVVSTSANVVRASVESLTSGGDSKFDDPRLKAALEDLPVPEDALVFYDGRQQFRDLRNIGQFIREKASEDEKALRVAGLMERFFDELAILDYEVAVEYTEGQRNIKTTHGQLVPDAQEKLLYQVATQGEPFENWQRWVPADAQSYGLFVGPNLHALYEGVMAFLAENIPEAKEGLEKFEQAQEKCGVHLDQDILQAFSGECVSITLPASSPTVFGGQDSVVAIRCHKPERIRELIGECVERLNEHPLVRAQQLKLTPSEELEGFEEISASICALFGARPVIGFHDGWMIFASNAAAARKVLDTRSGEAPAIDTTQQFQKFGLKIDGPVYAISYQDLAASTRQAAQFIRQAGAVAPIIVGMAGAKAGAEEMKPLEEAVALLPSLAKVAERSDYLEARLSVVQAGDSAGTYVKQSVTLVRPPNE